MESLRRKLEAGEALVAGVLSGTSADGIDVVLARPRVARGAEAARLVALDSLAFATHSFEPALAARVRAALDGAALGPREIAMLGRDLGTAFGSAARSAADAFGQSLDLVASHGQTIYHHDGAAADGKASLQIGDGDFCAEAAGCAVVSDFRQRDLAAGGEGAPLSALVDDLLLRDAPRPLLLLNLGGMANLSWYGRDDACIAFDTGPAGSLLDGVMRRFHDEPYDAGGARALAGTVDEALCDELCAHPFLAAPPPKSTGRDTFGARFVDDLIERAAARGIRRSDDLLATCVQFIGRSIARATEHLPERPPELLVAGGGVHNIALLRAITGATGLEARSSATRGLDPDAREALVFAGLGVRAVLGEASTRPGVSGARPGRVLGKISPPVSHRN